MACIALHITTYSIMNPCDTSAYDQTGLGVWTPAQPMDESSSRKCSGRRFFRGETEGSLDPVDATESVLWQRFLGGEWEKSGRPMRRAVQLDARSASRCLDDGPAYTGQGSPADNVANG